MAAKDRKKQLARQRYERQQARRQAEEARARTLKIVGAAVAAVVVIGGGTAAALVLGKDDKKKPAKPEAQATQSKAKPGECAYNASQDQGALKDGSKPPAKPAYNGPVKATIKTSQGDIGLTLDGAKAPCATNSFAFLASKKFWAGSHCHRLSTSAGLQMLQCGDPTGTGQGGPGYKFANENTAGAKYDAGTLAMANAGPDTNGSQFFLVYGNSQLSPDYTVLGKITSGLDVLQAVAKGGIAKAGDDGTGEPKKRVTIEDVAIAGK
ncbi:peptidylprolyl isomerase [Actinomadura rupiterrae]|uniref:peptidylprolyl isomerase n=1 Tax=Actinomadura rupiterrae TaxID=559627 RepID=UPI0020A5294F|nr:peptidylprolyl isomerase [Actinomadura rupiterrae]MCP2340853.1 peptidyl-prolyl cis-trans isomerase B (cyclophilin B) [Actinomadura rupiterrae]